MTFSKVVRGSLALSIVLVVGCSSEPAKSPIADGLTDEVRGLLANDRQLSRTASQALGYKEVVAFLQGSGTLEETIERVQTRTRQFAKRQCTWFRNLAECREIEMTGTENADELAEKILAAAAPSREPVTEKTFENGSN